MNTGTAGIHAVGDKWGVHRIMETRQVLSDSDGEILFDTPEEAVSALRDQLSTGKRGCIWVSLRGESSRF